MSPGGFLRTVCPSVLAMMRSRIRGIGSRRGPRRRCGQAAGDAGLGDGPIRVARLALYPECGGKASVYVYFKREWGAGAAPARGAGSPGDSRSLGMG